MAIPLIAKRGLVTFQGATGPGQNTVTVDNCNALSIAFQLNAGNATVNSIQMEQSIDGGTTWIGPIFATNVATGTVISTATTGSTNNVLYIVTNPVGMYRANVTAFTAGFATAIYEIGAGFQE